MSNNKAVFIILSAMLAIVILLFVFSWGDFSAYRTHSTLQLKYSEIISNRAAQQSPAIMSSVIAGASSIMQLVPLIIAIVIMAGVTYVLYKTLMTEKKKPRVAFVKGREAKRLDPEAFQKKKIFERERVRQLGRETNDLERELGDLAKIAKVNAMSNLANKPTMPRVEIPPYLQEDEHSERW